MYVASLRSLSCCFGLVQYDENSVIQTQHGTNIYMYAFVLKSIWKKHLLLLLQTRLETTKVSLKTPGFFASNTGCRHPDFLYKISQISPQTQSYAQSGAEVTCNSTFIPSTSRHESHESNVNMICSYLITEAATTFYISVTFINNNKSTPLLSGSLRVWRASSVSFITVIAVPLKLNMAPIYKYIYIQTQRSPPRREAEWLLLLSATYIQSNAPLRCV